MREVFQAPLYARLVSYLYCKEGSLLCWERRFCSIDFAVLSVGKTAQGTLYIWTSAQDHARAQGHACLSGH